MYHSSEAAQDEARTPNGPASAAISNAVVRLMSEHAGRGPTKAKTIITGDLITVMLEETLTKAERNLARVGKIDAVLEMRKELQHTMRDELIGAVEMLSQRKVIAIMSDNHIEPDMAVEVFVLAPERQSEPPNRAAPDGC